MGGVGRVGGPSQWAWNRWRARRLRRGRPNLQHPFLLEQVERAWVPDSKLVRGRGPLFIIGSPRSGTTWIKEILTLHPKVVSHRESHAYPQLHAALRGVTSPEPGLEARLLEAFEERRRLRPHTGLHEYMGRDLFAELVDRGVARWRETPGWTADDLTGFLLDRAFARLHTVVGGRPDELLVEKTPGHQFHAERIVCDFPDALFLHMLRDGRDVCVSLGMRAKQLDYFPEDRSEQIELWRTNVEASLEVEQRWPERSLRVRFEATKRDPDREIRRVFDFAGLAHDDGTVQDVAERTRFSNKGDGTGRAEGSHRWRGEAGAWREHFSPSDEALFKERAGPLMERLGYDL